MATCLDRMNTRELELGGEQVYVGRPQRVEEGSSGHEGSLHDGAHDKARPEMQHCRPYEPPA